MCYSGRSHKNHPKARQRQFQVFVFPVKRMLYITFCLILVPNTNFVVIFKKKGESVMNNKSCFLYNKTTFPELGFCLQLYPVPMYSWPSLPNFSVKYGCFCSQFYNWGNWGLGNEEVRPGYWIWIPEACFHWPVLPEDRGSGWVSRRDAPCAVAACPLFSITDSQILPFLFPWQAPGSP